MKETTRLNVIQAESKPVGSQVRYAKADIVHAIETTQALRMIRIAQDAGCIPAHQRTERALFGDTAEKENLLKMKRLWEIARDNGWCVFKNGIWQLTEKGSWI